MPQGAIAVSLVFVFERPKNWPKKRRPLYHTSKPDTDNLIKFFLDAGNGILWQDDCQIADITAQKVYGEVAQTVAIIRELDNEQGNL